MQFFHDIFLAASYLLERSYMSWFFTVPTAGAIILFIGSLVNPNKKRGE